MPNTLEPKRHDYTGYSTANQNATSLVSNSYQILKIILDIPDPHKRIRTVELNISTDQYPVAAST